MGCGVDAPAGVHDAEDLHQLIAEMREPPRRARQILRGTRYRRPLNSRNEALQCVPMTWLASKAGQILLAASQDAI